MKEFVEIALLYMAHRIDALMPGCLMFWPGFVVGVARTIAKELRYRMYRLFFEKNKQVYKVSYKVSYARVIPLHIVFHPGQPFHDSH